MHIDSFTGQRQPLAATRVLPEQRTHRSARGLDKVGQQCLDLRVSVKDRAKVELKTGLELRPRLRLVRVGSV